MTRDRDTAQGEIVWAAADEVWRLTGRPVEATEVAQRTGLDVDTVRDWLAEAEGRDFEVAGD